MLKRHEIEILLRAGHPKTEVARLDGVSARSVHRIAEENPVVDVNDSAEQALRDIEKSSIRLLHGFHHERFGIFGGIVVCAAGPNYR